MKYGLICLALIFCGCLKVLDRKETIAAVKECKEAGLNAKLKRHGIAGGIRGVECIP